MRMSRASRGGQLSSYERGGRGALGGETKDTSIVWYGEKQGSEETLWLSTASWAEEVDTEVAVYCQICQSGTKLHQGRFTLDARKNVSTLRVVTHWNMLPTEVVNVTCLSVFKTHLDNVFKNVFFVQSWSSQAFELCEEELSWAASCSKSKHFLFISVQTTTALPSSLQSIASSWEYDYSSFCVMKYILCFLYLYFFFFFKNMILSQSENHRIIRCFGLEVT